MATPRLGLVVEDKPTELSCTDGDSDFSDSELDDEPEILLDSNSDCGAEQKDDQPLTLDPNLSKSGASGMSCTTMCCDEDQQTYQPNESTILSLFVKKGRRFLPTWYDKFPWITLCTTQNKVFCVYCRYASKHKLFTFCKKGDEAFSLKGFDNYKKAVETFRVHENSDSHLKARIKCKSLNNPSIREQISIQGAKVQETRRLGLVKQLEAMKFLLRQGIALRGHSEEEGNLRQLLATWSKENAIVKTWVEEGKYMSHDIVNEMITLMGQSVLGKLLCRIKGADPCWYAIIADETADAAHREQFNLTIRYVDNDYIINEDSIGLFSLPNTTASTLHLVLIDMLIRCNLPLSLCRGQAYDGVLAALEKFEIFFGLKLGHLLFGAAEETSKALQAKDTSVKEAVSAVSVTRAFYLRQREDKAFDEFYAGVVAQANSLQIGEPKLPRYHTPPKRFGGADAHQFDEPKKYFRQKYFAACDVLIQELLDRFEQKEFMQPVLAIESLLIKSAKGECHADEVRTVKESVFKDDLNFDSLERHLGVLVDVVHLVLPQVQKVTSIQTICEVMKADPYRSMLSEVHKLLRLYLTLPITSSTSERAFSTLRRLQTYLRSTMMEQRLNNCMLLHIHKDLTDSLDLHQVAKDFISAKEERNRYFGNFVQK